MYELHIDSASSITAKTAAAALPCTWCVASTEPLVLRRAVAPKNAEVAVKQARNIIKMIGAELRHCTLVNGDKVIALESETADTLIPKAPVVAPVVAPVAPAAPVVAPMTPVVAPVVLPASFGEPAAAPPPADADGVPAGFEGLFGRDAQIRLVWDAWQAYQAHDKNRFHGVLYGPPGSAKTALLAKLGALVGEQDVDWVLIDAPNATAAGAKKKLTECPGCKVLILEEVEKVPDAHLNWLLGILDSRSEIRTTNARETSVTSCNVLVFATVNNMELFRKKCEGALASRFSHEVYCPAPDAVVLARILRREIDEKGGKVEWIQPTLELAAEYNLSDPRKIIPLCFTGGDRLLSGAFQADYRATRPRK